MEDANVNLKCYTFKIHRDNYLINYISKRWLFILLMIFILECYINVRVLLDYKAIYDNDRKIYQHINTNVPRMNHNKNRVYFKYPLINDTEIAMDYKNRYNSSYDWFTSMKHLFKNIGDEETTRYSENTPICYLKASSLGQIVVNKTKLKIAWVQRKHRDVKPGGYHAPAHCRPAHRVAVIVPYRDRRENLVIFLHYIHPLLKKQLLEYRIFVIEQNGIEKFNKGTLYNVAYLETQRFGTWHCLIFHDVDLIPEDERISYSCPEHPTHMSAAVEAYGYELQYNTIFGGVTALTPAQYETVNGYSNLYWNWGGEDDDMYARLLSKNYSVLRYNSSIARYATLPHIRNERGQQRYIFLNLFKVRFPSEGLTTTKYEVIKVTKEKLYTHLQVDVNPTKIKINTKKLLQQYLFNLRN